MASRKGPEGDVSPYVIQEVRTAFGERMRELREASDVTIQHLAQRMGLQLPYLRRIEGGRQSCSRHTHHALQQFFPDPRLAELFERLESVDQPREPFLLQGLDPLVEELRAVAREHHELALVQIMTLLRHCSRIALQLRAREPQRCTEVRSLILDTLVPLTSERCCELFSSSPIISDDTRLDCELVSHLLTSAHILELVPDDVRERARKLVEDIGHSTTKETE